MNKTFIFCDKLIKACLYLLVFALPIFFLPWSFEFLEFNKQNLLIVLTLIAGLAWLGKMIAGKAIVFRKSFLNLLVLFYLVIYALSSFFSVDKFRSFVGDSGLEKDGLITIFCFVLLYFIIANNVQEIKTVKNIFYSFFLSSALVALFSFLQFLGINIISFAQNKSFNPIGTLNALGIFLSAVLIFVSTFFLKIKKELPNSGAKEIKNSMILKTLIIILAVLSLFLLIAIDNWAIWASLILALALILAFVILRAHEIANVKWLIIPMAALTLAILLFFVRTPINFGLPAEIAPSFRASAQIEQKTLQEAPLLGSGPGTFVFDYAKYKPQGVNQTPLWNIKFDRSISRVLTMLATTGLLGFFSWLFLVIFLAVKSFVNLVKEKPGPRWIYNLGIFSAWFLLLTAKFFYSSNLTLEFLFWLTTALVAVFTFKNFVEIPLETSPRTSLLLSFLLTLGIIFSISTFYLLGQRSMADFKFQQAVLADQRGEETEKITDYLDQAVALNRFNDVYFRNLTQSLLAEINQKLQKEPTEENFREIQNLIAAAVSAGKRATELSPKNASNWSVLASVYQTIIPLQISGTDEWAVNSYSKAIELEPDNPFLYTELGKVYTSIADLKTQKLEGASEELKKTLQSEIKENLAKAEEQFGKAINLKSDYAPAHFELALIYSRQGKTGEAISKLEAMKVNLPNDIGVAFQLGLLYYQNKEQNKAIVELERAVKLTPNFANARWYLATIYEEQGKKDLAVAELEEILKTNPENETVKKKLEALNSPPSAESAPIPEPIPEEPEKKP